MDDEVTELIGAVRRASVVLERVAENARANLGVAATDLAAMELLSLGRLTAGELAAELGVGSGTLTGIVDRLLAAGYARREQDPLDRRRVFVSLTAKGRRRFREAFRERWQWLHSVTNDFSPREVDAVVRFLMRMHDIVPTERTRGVS